MQQAASKKKLEDVIEPFIAGDQDVFKFIYQETSSFLFRVIYRMVKSKQEAEDLLQDVYLKIFENKSSYNQEKASFNTWVYRIAVNHTLNYLKRRSRLTFLEGEPLLSSYEEDHLDKLSGQEDLATVRRALAAVKPDFRVCLVLADVEERSYEEIAAILNIKIGTVRSRLNRGRKALLKIYRKETAKK